MATFIGFSQETHKFRFPGYQYEVRNYSACVLHSMLHGAIGYHRGSLALAIE